MDIERIREKFRLGEFSIWTHALIEAMKDRLIPDDRKWIGYRIRKR